MMRSLAKAKLPRQVCLRRLWHRWLTYRGYDAAGRRQCPSSKRQLAAADLQWCDAEREPVNESTRTGDTHREPLVELPRHQWACHKARRAVRIPLDSLSMAARFVDMR